ncbi:hypothetical protein OSB04_019849 [Centaurea solstitialis]|uniref:Retrovirus-related Pol polyprotein from transposon TNT 1-94-like beta-barrel domain-containing protein n=1 Tax=Centaurea solstitialis TaxID=347529 RepID=A0AA38T4J9_9ASTR|nr:hypothetical protein OSB04_019849 [Centaurea solstitialis]
MTHSALVSLPVVNRAPASSPGHGRGRNSSREGQTPNSGHGRSSPSEPLPNTYPPWAWWAPPLCPYPTRPNTWPNNQWPNHFPPIAPVALLATAHVAYEPPPFVPNKPNLSAQTPNLAPQTQDFDALNPSDLGTMFQSMNLNYPDSSWYMDTGASSHMTTDSGKTQTPLSSSSVRVIFVCDDNGIPVKGSGNTLHITPQHSFRLHNILYTPNIIKNLQSIRQLTRDNNVYVEFDYFGFFFAKDLKTGRVLSRHNSPGDLYSFTTPEPSSSAHLATSSTDQWHNCLGHLDTSFLDFFILVSLFLEPLSICHSFQILKSKQLPFYDSHSTTFAPFDIIHCDLWKTPISSTSGYKYYMVLINNFTICLDLPP